MIAQTPLAETSEIAGIAGASSLFKQCLEEARIAADSNEPVLILGETGTGKGLIAQAIANLSRRGSAYYSINCAACPEHLFESEMFGHKRGAFTDAHSSRPGRLKSADGGTVLFDDISALPLLLQAKLLQAIEDGIVYPIGADKPQKIDVRALATANLDPLQLIEEGKFREDLYYRLAVIELWVPPLRERPEDIEPLARSLFESNARTDTRLSEEALDWLQTRPWRGNVRELFNLLRRVLLRVKDREITVADLDRSTVRLELTTLTESSSRRGPNFSTCSLADGREAFESELISRRFAQLGSRMAVTANSLGINRTTLHNKMKRYGVGQRNGNGHQADD